jgi:L-amino acid N-acyltransferase YncA
MGEIEIRNAGEEDLPGILAIYNDAVANSTAVFSDRPATIGERREWLAARSAQDFPVLVAREHGEVLAFATYGGFRTWPGYRLTVEHSVYVAATRRRAGLGRRLLGELIARARAAGMHAMVAGIDADNAPSLQMHAALGFEQVGMLPEVARKFDRWLDLVFMQLML